MAEVIAFFDHHEGTGTWAAAIATLAAVLVSLGLALGGLLKERVDQRQRERDRLSIVTSRNAVHQCLQLVLVYRPRDRQAGLEVRARILGPSNAYLVEAIRRPMSQGDQRWVEVRIGHVGQSKDMVIPLTWRMGDPDDALRGAVYVTNGPGEQWMIDAAQLEVSVYRVGGRQPLTTTKGPISPVGEDQKAVEMGRRPI